MTSDDLNSRLSELIEPMPKEHSPSDIGSSSKLKAWYFLQNEGWQPRAWDTDETANAMLLEMMPYATLHHFSGSKGRINSDEDFWACSCLGEHAANDPDRKLAVRAAALAYFEVNPLPRSTGSPRCLTPARQPLPEI